MELGWVTDDDDVTDDVTDVEEEERLQDEGEGAAMLTKPVNKLSRGSAHRLLPLETEFDGSKEKRPL